MTIFLRNEDLSNLLEPSDIVQVLRGAYMAYAQGHGVCAPRQDLQGPKDSLGHTYQLGTVAGVYGDYAVVRLKSDMTYKVQQGDSPKKEKYCGSPGSYFGLLLLFNAKTGVLLAIIQDGLIQRLRVGADSAIGTGFMARQSSTVLGIFGSGGMAMTHARTIASVRPISRILVYSPTVEHRIRFAEELGGYGLSAQAVQGPEDLYASADILCACTNVIGDVIEGKHLRPGVHITAIGGKLDHEGSQRVDRYLRLGTATQPVELVEAPPFEEECLSYSPNAQKSDSGGTSRYASIPTERRVMLADLLTDPDLGRTGDDQITFSERGNVHGIQFCAVAAHVYERALSVGVGLQLPTGGFIQTIRN
jgi:alanine dehydrogenase